MKSLRGHSADIINVICVNDHTDNLQNPTPPLVISLSSDMVVYAWDVKEVGNSRGTYIVSLYVHILLTYMTLIFMNCNYATTITG